MSVLCLGKHFFPFSGVFIRGASKTGWRGMGVLSCLRRGTSG